MAVLNQLPVIFRKDSVESQIDRLFDDAIRSVTEWSQAWDPRCNVFEDEQGFTVQMALPGLEADRIDVQVEKNVLHVKGERKNSASEDRKWYRRDIGEGAFSCSFRLPDDADQEKAMASYRQGLLTITFPKREKARPRQITIACQ